MLEEKMVVVSSSGESDDPIIRRLIDEADGNVTRFRSLFADRFDMPPYILNVEDPAYEVLKRNNNVRMIKIER